MSILCDVFQVRRSDYLYIYIDGIPKMDTQLNTNLTVEDILQVCSVLQTVDSK
jgi:hypothetical protein